MARGWAIVTGASSGIGAAFAQALARRGHPILAVARRSQVLEAAAAAMRADGGTVENLIADVASDEGVVTVVERVRVLGDVEILVNAAGVSTSGAFLAQVAERELESIRVNVEALYSLTRAVLPSIVERGHGGIINIASVVGFQAVPYWTTYAATKAFVLSFGEGLSGELRGSGVRVITVCPGFTRTGLYAKTGLPGLAGRILPLASPEAVARSGLAAYDAGRPVCVVGTMNRFMTFVSPRAPRGMVRALMARLFRPGDPPD